MLEEIWWWRNATNAQRKTSKINDELNPPKPYDYVVCTNLHKVIIREMTFIMIDTDDRNYLFNLSKFMMDNLYLYFYDYTWLTFN